VLWEGERSSVLHSTKFWWKCDASFAKTYEFCEDLSPPELLMGPRQRVSLSNQSGRINIQCVQSCMCNLQDVQSCETTLTFWKKKQANFNVGSSSVEIFPSCTGASNTTATSDSTSDSTSDDLQKTKSVTHRHHCDNHGHRMTCLVPSHRHAVVWQTTNTKKQQTNLLLCRTNIGRICNKTMKQHEAKVVRLITGAKRFCMIQCPPQHAAQVAVPHASLHRASKHLIWQNLHPTADRHSLLEALAGEGS